MAERNILWAEGHVVFRLNQHYKNLMRAMEEKEAEGEMVEGDAVDEPPAE